MTSFAEQIKKFADKTKQKYRTVLIGATFNLSKDIVLGTTYDTGHDRNNWIGAVDRMSRAKPLEYGEQYPLNARFAFETIRPATEQMPGKIFYLFNNVDYIRALEYDGVSGQARQGMVRINAMRWKDYVAEAARKAK